MTSLKEPFAPRVQFKRHFDEVKILPSKIKIEATIWRRSNMAEVLSILDEVDISRSSQHHGRIEVQVGLNLSGVRFSPHPS